MPIEIKELPQKTYRIQGIPETVIRSSYSVHRLDCFLKRQMDIILSLVGLVLLAPFLVTIAILVKLSSSGPMIYQARRIGKEKKVFKMYKFRTMIANDQYRILADHGLEKQFSEKFKLKNDPRITKIGTFLRRTALDELPQLINILRGDMSLVGPRPILIEEMNRSIPKERFSVSPGLTGLWQICGKNATSYKRKIQLDCYYVHHRNILMDFLILAQTIPALLFGKGFY